MKRIAVLFLVFLLLTGAAGCGARPASEGKLKAVASAFPEYDILRAVGGALLDVTLLLKPGMEAHSYEPTPQDILAIRAASLFVYGGGESDVWAERLLAADDYGSLVTLSFMDHALLRAEETQDYMTVEEAEEAGDEYDEHVWTSPKNAVRLTEAVRDALAAADPVHKETYGQNAEAYIARLSALDAEFAALAKSAKRNLLLVGDRFPFLYLVREYGFNYAAAFPGCSGETDANPATVAHLIDTAKAEGVPVVFKCDLSAGKLADTVAEAAGAKVLTLWSGHTVSKEDFDAGVTLPGLLERDLEAMREALN